LRSGSDRKSFSNVDYDLIAVKFGASIAGALRQGLRVVAETTEPPDPSGYLDGRVPWTVILALAGFNAWLMKKDEVERLAPDLAGRAARFAAWEPGGPPPWFADLAEVHLPVVEASLKPWIAVEAERLSDSTLRGALQLALSSPRKARVALLAPLKPKLALDAIPNSEMFKSIVKAMRADSTLSTEEARTACKAKLEASTLDGGALTDSFWLRAWLEEDAASAIDWIEERTRQCAQTAAKDVVALAKVVADFKWLQIPPSSGEVSVLERLDSLLRRYQPEEGDKVDPEDQGHFGESVVVRARRGISGVLVQTPGAGAHRALVAQLARETDAAARPYLNSQVFEHAELEAALELFSPADINCVATPFALEPKSEPQLFVQVMSRLQEVRLMTEQGPFSDRELFRPEMTETSLQNWLAARLVEQPSRKYSVAREEEVDNDKMPDIQAAVAAGKVCIEIKPLSRRHAYTASSLTETLRTQIAEQYLRGLNSRHGVLVLFRLDDKKWKVPGFGSSGTFLALVAHLEQEARAIQASNNHIAALMVIGIDCVPPPKIRVSR